MVTIFLFLILNYCTNSILTVLIIKKNSALGLLIMTCPCCIPFVSLTTCTHPLIIYYINVFSVIRFISIIFITIFFLSFATLCKFLVLMHRPFPFYFFNPKVGLMIIWLICFAALLSKRAEPVYILPSAKYKALTLLQALNLTAKN